MPATFISNGHPEAIKHVRKAVDAGWLKHDPELSPLRAEAEFCSLVQRFAIPQIFYRTLPNAALPLEDDHLGGVRPCRWTLLKLS